MKNKKNNNKIINLCVIISIIFLMGSLFLMLNKSKKIDNHITEINYQEYSELINKDEYSIIILTMNTCSHCTSYKPYVNYVLDDYNLVAYELSLNSLSYDEYILIHDKYSMLKDKYNDDGNPVISTPTTIITKNGEEIAMDLGNLGYNGFLNLLKENEIIK